MKFIASFLLLFPSVLLAQSSERVDQRTLRLNDITIQVLLDSANLPDGQLEIGEITLPAQTRGGTHVHRTLEVFYVLSGRLEHTVNGSTTLLGPGQIGIVYAGDSVRHAVPFDEDLRALIVWGRGGALQELKERYGFVED